MFVLTTTAKAVRESNDPHLGAMLAIVLIVIVAFIIILTVKDIR